MNDYQSDAIAIASQNPDGDAPVQEILRDMDKALTAATPYLDRMAAAADVRHCRWDGQSDDGRKHEDDIGREPFPFEGCSDARVKVAEEVGFEIWLVLMSAVFRADASFQPRQLTEENRKAASTLGDAVRYYLTGPMRREIRNVFALAFDWMVFYGLAVIHVSWHTRRQLRKRTLTAMDLLNFVMTQGAQELESAAEAAMEEEGREPDEVELEEIAAAGEQTMETVNERVLDWLTAKDDKAARDKLVEVLLQYDDGIQNPQRVASLLQRNQEAEYYTAEVVESRPCVEALLPGVDILFPPETRDLQKARWVARIRWMTYTEVMAAAKIEGWKDEWRDGVLNHPGQAFDYTTELEWVLGGGGIENVIPMNERNENAYQIAEVWQRAVTEDGIPFIRVTLVHQSMPGEFGKDEMYSPGDGSLPFVAFKRQHQKTLLWDSIGLATDVQTDQDAIKVQFDARTDHTSLSVSPPLIKQPQLAGAPQGGRVRPGGELIEFREGELRWMTIPGDTAKSIEIERALWERLARRYGRIGETVPPALSQMHMEVTVHNVFTDLTEVLRHIVAVMQEWMPDLENVRFNAGKSLFSARGRERALSATRADIGGTYDVDISFDVRDLDLNWLREKLELLANIAIPLDSQAVIDRGLLIKLILDAVDPRLEQAAKDGAEAALSEEQDELMALAVIVAGEEPPYVEGQNHALRLQVLQRALQRSPRLDSIIRGDEQVAKVLEARMKMHQQQVTQEENKVIGRQGAAQILKGD